MRTDLLGSFVSVPFASFARFSKPNHACHKESDIDNDFRFAYFSRSFFIQKRKDRSAIDEECL